MNLTQMAFRFLLIGLILVAFQGKSQTIIYTPKAENPKLKLGLSDVASAAKMGSNLRASNIENSDLHRFKEGNTKILVDAIATTDGAVLEKELSEFGAEIVARNQNVVSCWVAIKQIESIVAKSKNLLWMQSALKPTTNSGVVQTQGDVAQRSNLARSLYGLTGAGVKIGVLSDSYNRLGGAAAGVAAGELPGVGNPNGKLTPVTVLSDYNDGKDEGRAMLEVVHDIAPDAALYFYTGFFSEADFANGIRALADAGCKVIIDDVSYFSESIFQDGPIAQAIEFVVNVKGVVYFSSAGNSKDQSYEAPYQASTFQPFNDGETAHNFGTAANPVYFLPVSGAVRLGLQWDEPFITAGNGSPGSASDLNFYVLTSIDNGITYSVQLSGIASNIGGNPIELLSTSAGMGVKYVLITKKAGTNPTRIKVNDFSRTLDWSVTPANVVGIKAGTVIGHHNSAFSITCGAADYRQTPAFGVNPPVIEAFSSKGGTPVFFTPAGLRLTTPDDRLKPNIVAPDNGNTSFFIAGYNPDGDGSPNFNGTSAATSHAGAVAALMLQGNPVLTQTSIKTALINSATDMNDPATPSFDVGFDYGTGNGLIKADVAVGLTINPDCPTVMLTVTGATTFCEGDSALLSTSTASGYSFQWKTNGIVINGATQPQLIVKQSGIYSVAVSRSGCTKNSNDVAITKKVGTPKPTTTSQTITVGTPITAGNGLQSTTPNCPSDAIQTYTGPNVGYDNNQISGTNPSVTFAGLANNVAKIKVSITWRKKKGGNQTTCAAADGMGNPYNEEVSFKIKAPNNTIVTLLKSGTYATGGAPAGVVTTVFEDDAAAVGTLPVSGTFKPTQNLSLFNGIAPNGIWELQPNDNGNQDPLCVQGFSVTVTTVGTGSASTITWHDAATAGTQVGSGPVLIPTNTAVGTYTYYAQASCPSLPICNTSIRVPATLTINCVTTPSAPSGTTNPTICANTAASLSATCATGLVRWYNANASTLLGTGSPLATPNLLTNTSYKVRCENGICASNFVTILVTVNSAQLPIITSFSPASGAVGSSINITGAHFNATPNQNIVFFGATRANVTASSATNLTVEVPVGATFQPTSVLNVCTALSANGLSPFKTTFPGFIGPNSFDPNIDLAAGTFPASVAIGDLDGDGKADLAVANLNSGTVSVYRNTSISGTISASSFATKVDFLTAASPRFVTIGDLDADGKLDIIVVNNASNSISIFRNTATVGSITTGSFAAKVDFATGTGPTTLSIGDLDNDGKPDLAVNNFNGNSVSVFKNTTSSGSISASSFAAKIDFATGLNPNMVVINDLDGDTKPDVVVVNYGSNTVSILRNATAIGSITANSLVPKIDYDTGTNPSGLAIGDLDNDGKNDVVVANFSSNSISVFRNTTTNGIGSLASKVDFTTATNPIAVRMGDLDGDGRPDLAVANTGNASNSVSIFRNTAAPGNITASSFMAKIDYPTGLQPYSLSIGDLDGDRFPDWVVTNSGSNNISIFRNSPKLPQGSIAANGPFCSSGTGQLTWTAAFGTGPYTIVYNDGIANRTATNVVSGIPFNVFTNPVITTSTYTLVSVTDAASFVRSSDFTGNMATIAITNLLTIASPIDDYSSGMVVKTASSINGKIIATNKVTGTANVIYSAKSIELNAGFKADNGTVFLAKVGGCN